MVLKKTVGFKLVDLTNMLNTKQIPTVKKQIGESFDKENDNPIPPIRHKKRANYSIKGYTITPSLIKIVLKFIKGRKPEILDDKFYILMDEGAYKIDKKSEKVEYKAKIKLEKGVQILEFKESEGSEKELVLFIQSKSFQRIKLTQTKTGTEYNIEFIESKTIQQLRLLQIGI